MINFGDVLIPKDEIVSAEKAEDRPIIELRTKDKRKYLFSFENETERNIAFGLLADLTGAVYIPWKWEE